MNLDRITFDPEVCGGRPCIRGMRIRISDMLGMLAAGDSRQDILRDYLYLEDADIDAALEYGQQQTNHLVLKTG
jgi:uncharacterized protein (DUF433 family)